MREVSIEAQEWNPGELRVVCGCEPAAGVERSVSPAAWGAVHCTAIHGGTTTSPVPSLRRGQTSCALTCGNHQRERLPARHHASQDKTSSFHPSGRALPLIFFELRAAAIRARATERRFARHCHLFHRLARLTAPASVGAPPLVLPEPLHSLLIPRTDGPLARRRSGPARAHSRGPWEGK